MKNNILLIAIILLSLTFIYTIIKSNQNLTNYHECLNSIDGTDAECDSCYQVIYCK